MTGCGNYGMCMYLEKKRNFNHSPNRVRQHMGGHMPKTLDIHNPGLSTKVTIDIPEAEDIDSGGLYSLFNRENVINLCVESLRSVPDWKFLMEREIKEGKSLQLAWRVDANLDWVWLETDVFGEPRDWAVLCGLAFKQVCDLLR